MNYRIRVKDYIGSTMKSPYVDSDGYLAVEYVAKFNLVVDIFEPYSRCFIVIKDITRDIFNYIKTGMDIDVIFTDENKIYTNHMKVLSFKKTPGPQSPAVDELFVELISSWYFVNSYGSKAYSGSTSTIIEEIINKNFINYIGSDHIDITTTEDKIKYRYQLKEKTQDFLLKLPNYSIKGNMPVFLFMDARGYLRFKSITDMMNNMENNVALIPAITDKLQKLPSNASNYSKVYMNNFRFNSDGSNAGCLTEINFTTPHFVSNSYDFDSSIKYYNTELSNSQSSSYTPSKTKIMGWELQPDDARAIAIRQCFLENSNMYSLSAICVGADPELLDVGRAVRCYLPYEPATSSSTGKKSNLGEGLYIIKHAEFVVNNLDNMRKTKLELMQVKY